MKRALTAWAVLATAFVGAARADDVELATGEKLKGTIVTRDAKQIVMDHPVLGRITIPVEKLAPPPPPKPEWTFRAEFGASGTDGNVDQSALHAAVGAILDNDKRRFKAELGWFRAETEDVKTADKTHLEAIHDWKFAGSKWSVFAAGRVDWDDFQDWEERASIGAGVGYALVDERDLKSRVRVGFAETREWGGSDDDDDGWRPEGLLGADLFWNVNDTNTIEARVTYFPDLRDGGEYRVVGSVSWSVKLAVDSPLSLKIGVDDEYDSHRDAPFEKNDLRYFAALVATF
jgi:hypothetical protein